MVFVDLDTKGEADGIANWQAYLQGKGVEAPPTVTVQTPSGGRHLWFRDDTGCQTSAGRVAPGVDVRGEGGFVLVPPSEGYTFLREWTPDTVLPDLPEGTLEPTTRAPAASAVDAQEGREPTTADHAYGILTGVLADVATATPGTRNPELARATRALEDLVLDGHLDEDSARMMLRGAARRMPVPLPEWEIRKTIDANIQAVKAKRGTASEQALPERGQSGRWGAWVPTSQYICGANTVPSMWGPEDRPLWLPGQSTLISGESSTGKSTLAVSLAVARIGLLDRVLGWPVVDDGGVVLYLGLDRASQIAGLFERLLNGLMPQEKWQPVVDRRLVILADIPVPLTEERFIPWLADKAKAVGATTVVIDSLKEVIMAPSDEMKASVYNRIRQSLLVQGIQVLEVAHNRKATNDGKGGNGSMADVSGSHAIVSGAGCLLTLVKPNGGEEQTCEVILRHNKPLRGDEHPNRRLTMDKDTGLFRDADVADSISSRIHALFACDIQPGTRLSPKQVAQRLNLPVGASSVRMALGRLADAGVLNRHGESRNSTYSYTAD